MTRHETIIVGHGARIRSVRVERPRRRQVATGYSRELVHGIGLAAVADELGLAAMLPMGGVMTAERAKALDTRLKRSAPQVVASPAPGLLADDICRQFRPGGRFAPILWGEVL